MIMKNLMLLIALVAFIGVSVSPVKAIALKNNITVVDNDKDKKTDKKGCEKKCSKSEGEKKGCCAKKDGTKCNHEGDKKSCAGHSDSKGSVTPEKK